MRPMLATPGTHVPAGDAWVHEVKWDGVRALTEVRDGTLRMTSRNENVITVAWPELATSPYGGRDLFVDGEIIAIQRPRGPRTSARCRSGCTSARRRPPSGFR